MLCGDIDNDGAEGHRQITLGLYLPVLLHSSATKTKKKITVTYCCRPSKNLISSYYIIFSFCHKSLLLFMFVFVCFDNTIFHHFQI